MTCWWVVLPCLSASISTLAYFILTFQLFRRTDATEEWLQAKLWFNLADSCYHMVAGRLLTQLILEGIYVSLRRNLAQSHPIFQLLAPHFRSILAVNK